MTARKGAPAGHPNKLFVPSTGWSWFSPTIPGVSVGNFMHRCLDPIVHCYTAPTVVKRVAIGKFEWSLGKDRRSTGTICHL